MFAWLHKARPKTLIEWLIVAAIIAIILALVIPQAKWASSGLVTIPVEVIVFDAMSGRPIEGALVTILWAPPAGSDFTLEEYQERLSSGFSNMEEIGKATDQAGSVIIEHEFRTGASHRRPISHAHTGWYWVLVRADQYGGVTIPLRYTSSMPTTELKSHGRLPAYVGLTRIQSD